ncbi:MAG: ABC transporter substrate-binding protein [Acidimicrobiales bacterium]
MAQRGIDRRTFLGQSAALGGAVAFGGVAGAGLASCSSGTGGSAGSGPGSATRPVRGGSLTVGTMAEINGFSPSRDNWDTNGLLYANTVYDPLMAVARDGSIRPYLAQSLIPNPTYDRWTLTVRPGVAFHDGSPLTPAVIKANFDALASSTLTSGAVTGIASITTPGAMTVVFTLKQPSTGFDAALTTQAGYMVSQSMLDQTAADPNAPPTPVGTGPFVYADWQPNDHFTATRNPHYWQAGLPYLDQITFRPIVDTTQRENSLQGGTVDAIISIDPRTYQHFRDETGFQALYETSPVVGEPTMGFMLLNCKKPPTDDLRLRQALAKATDQVALQKLFGAGFVQPVNGLFLPGSPYQSDTGYPGFDPAGAAALVREYAAMHGTPSIQISTTPDPRTTRLVQVVQEMWVKAGVQATIGVVEQATTIVDLLTGRFQAVPSAQFGAVDPDLNYPWLSTTTVEPIGTVGLNFARNADPVIEGALQTAGSTLDAATRIDAWRTVNERLAKDLPYLWIGRDLFPFAAEDRVQGIDRLTLPDGAAGYSYDEGVFFPSQLWLGG